jgi:hypothetical protein
MLKKLSLANANTISRFGNVLVYRCQNFIIHFFFKKKNVEKKADQVLEEFAQESTFDRLFLHVDMVNL